MNRRKRNVQLIAILLLSGIVGISVFSYISSIETKVQDNYETSSIYFVTKQIALGSTLQSALDSSSLELSEFPKEKTPVDALLSLDGLDKDLVATYTLQPGQVLLRSSFGAESSSTGALVIPNGLLAISLTVPEFAKVGNFLQPGAKVSVFASGSTRANAEPVTQVLFPEVLVLAVGDNIEPSTNQPNSTQSTIVTLALTPFQAKKLVHATQNFTLYLGMLGNSVIFDSSSPVSNKSLIPTSEPVN